MVLMLIDSSGYTAKRSSVHAQPDGAISLQRIFASIAPFGFGIAVANGLYASQHTAGVAHITADFGAGKHWRRVAQRGSFIVKLALKDHEPGVR